MLSVKLDLQGFEFEAWSKWNEGIIRGHREFAEFTSCKGNDRCEKFYHQATERERCASLRIDLLFSILNLLN